MKAALKRQLERAFRGKIEFRPEILHAYSFDATQECHLPEAVLFVEEEEDIKRIIDFSRENLIPLVPRGAGVGYSGGAVPVSGGIVLSFERMNRILKIDPLDLQAEVEPGVITATFQRQVETFGLFYPPDPASAINSTLGGNVAENAGGPRCFKYGVTADYVLALEAYLMSGEKIHCGSKALKDVAGYNLKSLLIGSEGTLAIFSKIILRLIPLPEKRILFAFDFPDLQSAVDLVLEVIGERLQPATLEFIDRTALQAVFSYLQTALPNNLGAQVLLEIDGSSTEVENKREKLEKLVSGKTLGFQVADSSEAIENLWQIRRTISPAISTIRPLKINEDIAVPLSALVETVNFIREICERRNLLVVLFGHIGDGNIHTNLLVDPADQKQLQSAEETLKEIFSWVCSHYGSVSGEHGIGISKKRFLRFQYSPQEIELFRKIKAVFDPFNLLNPGKIF